MTTEAFPQQPSRLGLHVINAGYGESIVLELPGDRWGVVDCYASKLDKPDLNPTLIFLRERSVQELEFVALTHPRADHYHGLKDLLEHVRVKAFWWFGGVSSSDLARLVNGLRVEAFEAKDRRRQYSARYLDRTFRTMIQQRKAGTLMGTQMADFKPLYPLPFGGAAEDVRIHALAPHTDTGQRYQEELHKCFQDEQLQAKLPEMNQNQISAALLVEYGATRLILGGDVESESWEEVLTRVDPSRLKAHAVKVSHHGSRNGYCPTLWPTFCARGQTVAIVTPSHPHALPNENAIAHIRASTKQIVSTCTPAHTFSTEPQYDYWDAYEAGVQLSLRAVFPTFMAEKPFSTGVCSFWFDNQGQLQEAKLTPPAGAL